MSDDKTLRWGGCRDKIAEKLRMPGGAVQASRLHFLFHTLVVVDLSWDRNGHRGTAVTAEEFNRIAAWMKEEANELEMQEYAVFLIL